MTCKPVSRLWCHETSAVCGCEIISSPCPHDHCLCSVFTRCSLSLPEDSPALLFQWSRCAFSTPPLGPHQFRRRATLCYCWLCLPCAIAVCTRLPLPDSQQAVGLGGASVPLPLLTTLALAAGCWRRQLHLQTALSESPHTPPLWNIGPKSLLGEDSSPCNGRGRSPSQALWWLETCIRAAGVAGPEAFPEQKECSGLRGKCPSGSWLECTNDRCFPGCTVYKQFHGS